VDVWGRRAILLPATGYVVLASLITGGLSLPQDLGMDLGITSRMLAVIYNSSWALIPSIISSEIFPIHVRAKGIAVSYFINFLASYLVSVVNFYGAREIDPSYAYWIRAGIAIVAVIFVWLVVPETHNLSLEQTERIFSFSTPRSSNEHRRRIIRQDTAEAETWKIDLGQRFRGNGYSGYAQSRIRPIDEVGYGHGLQHHL